VRRSLDSIDAVFNILESLDGSKEKDSVRKIAEETGITKSTVHRILQSLTSIGWTYQDAEDKSYCLSLKFLTFANEWRMNLDIVKQFDPILRKISAECGQTAFLNIIDIDRAFCLHKVESESLVRVASVVGKEQAFHAGASGKVLLAYAPKWLVDKVLSQKLEAFTPFTVTDPAKIREQLSTIREQGYCFSVEEIDPGAAAVSVPSLNEKKGIVTAVSVAGTRFDFERDHEKWLSSLREAVKDVVPVSL